jgi:dihydrofolate reductase
MGKNTFNSIKINPLSNRLNIVLSRTYNSSYFGDNVLVFNNVEDMLDFLTEKQLYSTAWVIGGKQIFEKMFPFCSEIVLTKFHMRAEHVDTYVDSNALWRDIKKTVLVNEVVENNVRITIERLCKFAGI